MARNQVLYPRTQVGAQTGAFLASASYIIDQNGTTINAINGATSAIDYTGLNSAGAQIVINNAINALNATGGGTVFLKAGTFNIKGSITLKSNVNLIGEGYNSLIQQDSGTPQTSPLVNVIGTTGTHLTDCILMKFRAVGLGAGESQVNNPRGIYIRLADRVHLEKTWVTDTPSSNITLDQGTDLVCIDNWFARTGYNNIGVGEQLCLNIRIIGNRCIDATLGAGIACNSIQGDVIVIGNVCSGGVQGIYAQDYQAPYEDGQVIGCIIEGNVVKNVSGEGIVLNSATNVQIVNNYIHDCGAKGIRLFKGQSPTTDNIVVSGNIIERATNTGIDIQNSTGVIVSHNVVRDTVFSSNGYGIYLTNSNYCVLSNNISHNNGQSGFLINQSTYINIIGNASYNNGQNETVGDGIKFTDSGTPCQYCSIVGNQLYDNQGTKTQRNGLYLANSTDYCLASNNIVTPNKTKTIDPGTGTHNIIRNNIGYVTENSGTATIASGQTSIVVTHGLGYTPVAGDIVVVPTNSMGSATKFYIGTYTSTQFTITVDQDPGATTATFAWMARKN
jgi:parallel beta-helix repeat protein